MRGGPRLAVALLTACTSTEPIAEHPDSGTPAALSTANVRATEDALHSRKLPTIAGLPIDPIPYGDALGFERTAGAILPRIEHPLHVRLPLHGDGAWEVRSGDASMRVQLLGREGEM